ncbi:hypothetical protein ACIQF5_35635 [Streptomyces goshikiensis]|uniref:hypothetical protein n=1 Tax=Streptomyces goshikiensis TaxID=1942 RepID=UPI00382852E2
MFEPLLEGLSVDIVAIVEALAEQGITEFGAGILVQAGGRLRLDHGRVSQNASERNGHQRL